jgi:hypothetical protein
MLDTFPNHYSVILRIDIAKSSKYARIVVSKGTCMVTRKYYAKRFPYLLKE